MMPSQGYSNVKADSIPGYMAATASSRAKAIVRQPADEAAPKTPRAKRSSKAATATQTAMPKPPLIIDAPGIVRPVAAPIRKSINAVKTFPVYTVSREPGDESDLAPTYQHVDPAVLPGSSLTPANANSFGKDAAKNLIGHPYQDVSMENLHPVLFQLEEGEDECGSTAVTWEEDTNGDAVITTQGRCLRKICNLPRYVTRDISGLHLELLFRLDSRLVVNDLVDRMDEDVFDTGKKQPTSGNTINMRRLRFRELLGMKSWKPGRVWPTMSDVEVLDNLTAGQVNANTTMVIEEGKLWQPVFNKQKVLIHYVDSGLPLDFFLLARPSDVPSHSMLNTAALRRRVQTVGMLHNHGAAPDNWKRFGTEKGVSQENKNLPYWFNDSNAGNRGTGDVASKRGVKKFAETLREKERKIVEFDNLTHSEFMAEYVANNPQDTIAVAKRPKANQVKGNAARSAHYQMYRSMAELKGVEGLSASGTDAVSHGVEHDPQDRTAESLFHNPVQGQAGMTLGGANPYISYGPHFPFIARAEEKILADSVRTMKRRAEDNDAEIFGIIRPDSDRSFGQVGPKFQDVKRRKTAQPLGEVGIKRGVSDYFDDSEEPSSDVDPSTMNGDPATVTTHRKIKVQKIGRVRPPKGGALTIESGFPQPFGRQDKAWNPQGYFTQLTEGDFSYPPHLQTAPSRSFQSMRPDDPPFEPRGREESPRLGSIVHKTKLMQTDSGYGSQNQSVASQYSAPASFETGVANEDRQQPVAETLSPPSNTEYLYPVEGEITNDCNTLEDQGNLVSYAVGGQVVQPDLSNDALARDLEAFGAGEIDLHGYDIGELAFGDADSTELGAMRHGSVPQPGAATEVSMPQSVPTAPATEVPQAPEPVVYPEVVRRVYAAQSSLNAHNQLANNAAAAIQQELLRADYVDPEAMSTVWQETYGHFLGQKCTQSQVAEYLNTRM